MFRQGDTVVFNPDSLNVNYWDNLTYEEKRKYYGVFFKTDNVIPLEYNKLKLLTFICEHSPQTGHCVLMDMSDGKLIPMCHTNNFRLANDEEC